jgi:multiple sugar transport system substrate-binding protein
VPFGSGGRRIRARAFILTAVFLAVAAAGCTTRGADEGKIAISYTRWGDPAELDSTKEIIGHFMAENPDVIVRVDVVSWQQYWQKLTTAVLTGTAQDVWLVSPAYIEQYAAAGHVMDLMPFVEADPDFDLDDYFTFAFHDFSFAGEGRDLHPVPYGEGGLYAFTRDFNFRLLYYNRDHFDAAGVAYPTEEWTWDEYLEAGRKLTIDFDGDGIIDQWGIYGMDYTSLAAAAGGRTFDVENLRGNNAPREGNTIIYDAMQFCYDLIHVHGVSPSPSIQLEGDAFVTGKASMIIEGVWEIRHFNQARHLWDIASIPLPSKDHKRMANPGGVAHCVYSGTKNPEAAWRLVKFLSGDKSQRELGRSGTSVPVLKSAVFSEDFLAPFDRPPKESYPIIFKNLNVTEHHPRFIRGYLEYMKESRQLVQGVWLGVRTPLEGCKLLDETVDSIVREQYGEER